jgi:hypothetical protein
MISNGMFCFLTAAVYMMGMLACLLTNSGFDGLLMLTDLPSGYLT